MWFTIPIGVLGNFLSFVVRSNFTVSVVRKGSSPELPPNFDRSGILVWAHLKAVQDLTQTTTIFGYSTFVFYFIIAVCKDSYVVYACGFDRNGK